MRVDSQGTQMDILNTKETHDSGMDYNKPYTMKSFVDTNYSSKKSASDNNLQV